MTGLSKIIAVPALLAVTSLAQAATLNLGPGTLDPVPLSSLSNADVTISSDLQSVAMLEPSYAFAGVALSDPASFTLTFAQPVDKLTFGIAQSELYDFIVDVTAPPVSTIVLGGGTAGGTTVTFTDVPFNGPLAFGVDVPGAFTTATFSFQPGSVLRTDPSTGLDFTAPLGYGVASLEYHFAATAPVPEPQTYAMLMAGLGMLFWLRKPKGA